MLNVKDREYFSKLLSELITSNAKRRFRKKSERDKYINSRSLYLQSFIDLLDLDISMIKKHGRYNYKPKQLAINLAQRFDTYFQIDLSFIPLEINSNHSDEYTELVQNERVQAKKCFEKILQKALELSGAIEIGTRITRYSNEAIEELGLSRNPRVQNYTGVSNNELRLVENYYHREQRRPQKSPNILKTKKSTKLK